MKTISLREWSHRKRFERTELSMVEATEDIWGLGGPCDDDGRPIRSLLRRQIQNDPD